MKYWAIRLIAFLLSCGFGIATAKLLSQHRTSLSETNRASVVVVATRDPEAEEFTEVFTDDSKIGQKNKNKVEIQCFKRGDDKFARIKFYSLSYKGVWKQRQTFELQRNNVASCDPIIKDFNNDGLKDFTYLSNVAARGANELRTLFIYDKKADKLIHIKNSEEYPNLEYNKKLDCIDAWAFHGSTTTIFLKIKGDILKEFASVDTGHKRIVTITRKNGTSVTLRREKMNENGIYTRYSTFDPPRP